MAKMAFPEVVVWGEVAAVARARHLGRGSLLRQGPAPQGLDPRQRRAPSSSSAAAGSSHAFPPAPDAGEYSKVRDSNVETLLVDGTLDFATPPKFGIQELLPHLRNGRKVVLAELGHSEHLLDLPAEGEHAAPEHVSSTRARSTRRSTPRRRSTSHPR